MNKKRSLCTLVALLAALLAGCGDLTTKEIDIRDGVFLPSGRISIDISPQAERRSVPHTGHGIEISATGTSGKDTQDIAATDWPVIFGGKTFSGPGQLNHEFDWRFADVKYRYRHFFGESGSFGIEAVGGLGYAEFDLTTSSATQSATEKLGNGGIVAGFGVVWKFASSTSLQSRLTFFGSGDREGVSSASRFDVFVAQALGSHAAIRGGLAAWTVRSVRQYDDDAQRKSPIRARFGGPALELELAF